MVSVDVEQASLGEFRSESGLIFTAGPELGIWRSPTDNDGIKRWSGQSYKPLGRWLGMGLDRLSYKGSTTAGKGQVQLRRKYVGGEAKKAIGDIKIIASMGASGALSLACSLKVGKEITDIPRVGLDLVFPKEFVEAVWYGRGPGENYPDRLAGSPVGIHQRQVADMYRSPQRRNWRPHHRQWTICLFCNEC